MKLKLLPKMLLTILLPTILGLSILAYSGNRSSQNAIETQMDTQLSSLASTSASEMNNILKLLQDLTDSIQFNTNIQALIKMDADSNLQNKTDMDNQRRDSVAYLDEITVTYALVAGISVVNKEGINLAHTNEKRIGENAADRCIAVREALSTGKSGFDMRKLSITGGFGLVFSFPIKIDNVIMGAATTYINLPNLYESTVAQVKVAKTFNAFAYDENANIIMHKEDKYMGKNESGHSWVQEILKNEVGKLIYSFEGVVLHAYYAPIPAIDGYLVIEATRNELLAGARTVTRNILIVAGILIVTIAMIIFIIARGLSKTLGKSSSIALYVAAGNFDIGDENKKYMNHAMQGGDEVADLVSGMRVMIENLGHMVEESREKTNIAEHAVEEADKAKQLADAATKRAVLARAEGFLEAANQLEDIVNIIVVASDTLALLIEQSSRGAEVQASRVTETAAAMDEMSSTVLEVAKNAGTSADLSENTRAKAAEGAEITQKCKNAISAVRKDSMVLRENMSELANHAQSINTVMSVISDIADQTNLLALNAAIEAARAGDAGRGFAVVADEVRKLAEKTINSTSDVAKVIAAIQQSTEISVKQVDFSVKAIEAVTELSSASGESLQGILEIAYQSADSVRAIATASEEQSATADEIASTIAQVNAIATETSNSMMEANKAIRDLAEQTHALSQLIESLKNS